MKNKEKLQRSKSETNLKTSAATAHYRTFKNKNLEENILAETQSGIDDKTCKLDNDYSMLRVNSGVELAQLSLRPKSWSPDNLIASEIFSNPGMCNAVFSFLIEKAYCMLIMSGRSGLLIIIKNSNFVV